MSDYVKKLWVVGDTIQSLNNIEEGIYSAHEEIKAKADNAVANTNVNGLMSSLDKAKLDGIEANANNYTHPVNHPAIMITEDLTHKFVSDTEKAYWNAKQTPLSGDVTSHYHSTDRDWDNISNKPVIPTVTSQLIKDDVYTKTEINTRLDQKLDKNADIFASNLFIRSPNGTIYKIVVSDNGAISSILYDGSPTTYAVVGTAIVGTYQVA